MLVNNLIHVQGYGFSLNLFPYSCVESYQSNSPLIHDTSSFSFNVALQPTVDISRGQFLEELPTKTQFAFLICLTCVACCTHPALFDFHTFYSYLSLCFSFISFCIYPLFICFCLSFFFFLFIFCHHILFFRLFRLRQSPLQQNFTLASFPRGVCYLSQNILTNNPYITKREHITIPSAM